MPNNSPPPSSTPIFYNDMHTTQTTLPAPPTPTVSSPSPEQEPLITEHSKRIASLESRLDSVLFILSSQSHKLTTLTTKFDTLCNLTGIDVPDDKPVEARMKDYAMKFSEARENAEEAVLERKRTISNSSAGEDGVPTIVGLMPERKRTISIQRGCGNVKLILHLWALVDSVNVVDEKVEVKATEYQDFFALLRYANSCLEQLWDEKHDRVEVAKELQLDTRKWRVELEEAGTVATLTKSPTRMTNDDGMAEENYKGWYERNVVKGDKEEYGVVFRVDMKTGSGSQVCN